MPTTLTTRAVEGSTFVINIAPTDEDGAAVTPNTATWTLTDENGNVINSRLDVSIGTPSTSMDVVLSGADLPGKTGGGNRTLKLAFEGTYDSDAGSDLPLVDEVTFDVVSVAGA